MDEGSKSLSPEGEGEQRVRLLLNKATALLAATSETPRLDAELLMAHALGETRERMLLARLDEAAPAGFAALLAHRLGHEPVAYITGKRAFWTIELAVGPGVLVPRADSETLIEAAVDHFAGTAGPGAILDLGTGSGALLLAALDQWPEARGIGVDASTAAVAIARANAAAVGLADRARILVGDWADGGGPHDLILCNPPYIATGEALPPEVADHEPHAALFAGADGLAAYRRIAPLLRGRITPGGMAAIEIGHLQADAVTALLRAEGLDTAVRCDLAGRDRCVIVYPASV
jgi:release factor glutamine methyltransferase